MPSQVIQLKISLLGSRPLIYRRIHILANSKLRTLQYTIRDLMEWKQIGGYYFIVGDLIFSDPEVEPDIDGLADDSKISVVNAAKKTMKSGGHFEFIHNSEACWRHKIEIEELIAAIPNERYPICIGFENEAPPDSYGGLVFPIMWKRIHGKKLNLFVLNELKLFRRKTFTLRAGAKPVDSSPPTPAGQKSAAL